MKGLLLKDWYTLIKQMKIMLVLMLVFACVPGYSMAAFAVVYTAMLPVTALAYDERSKWDELAAMLPYSVKEIVGGKYVLGVTAVAAAGAVAAAAQLILSRFGWTQFDAEAAFALLFTACLALIMLAIYLPVMFRLGVEKGRVLFMILICASTAAGVILSDKLSALIDGIGSPVAAALVLLAIAAAAQIASFEVSVRFYEMKRK